MLVMVGEKFACIKIIGRANFNSSIDFRALLNGLLQQGFSYFILEVSECTLMDSTFLGVLAGFGIKLAGGQKEPTVRPIELLNANNRIIDLLENLGVLHLFSRTEGPLKLECQQTRDYAPLNPTREEVTRACLEAHETLMEIDPNNVPKFKEVAQFLAEDLKKLQSPNHN